VPQKLLTQILDAAIRVPSAGNAQNWAFLVVRDPEQRRQLGMIYRKASDIASAIYAARGRPPHLTETQFQRLMSSGGFLWDHMAEAPVILVPCQTPPALPPPPETLPAEVRARYCGPAALYRAYPRRQHLSRGAEHRARVPRPRTRHHDHDQSPPSGNRGEGRARGAGRGAATSSARWSVARSPT
jgi:nitroreductase